MSISYYIQVGVAFLVLGVILLLVNRFTKKMVKQKYTGDIKVIDRRYIDNQISLVLASVKDKTYFLSVSPKGVEKLDQFND